MSTRATITFLGVSGETETQYVKLYHHFDGYIDGLGHDIGEYLRKFTIVNGIGINDKGTIANGFECLIAQFIRDFKTEVGNLYVISADSDLEEYNYEIKCKNDTGKADDIICIRVTDWNDNEIFNGTPSELAVFEEEE